MLKLCVNSAGKINPTQNSDLKKVIRRLNFTLNCHWKHMGFLGAAHTHRGAYASM